MCLRQRCLAIVALSLAALVVSGSSTANEPEAQLRSEAVALLVQALRDPDMTVVVAAHGALGQARPREAVPLLIPLLKEKDRRLQEAAAYLLANLPTRESTLALIEAGDAQKGELRMLIANLLLAHPHSDAEPEALAFFLRLSRESDPALRTLGFRGLGQILSRPRIES
jgi:hypothetical protein